MDRLAKCFEGCRKERRAALVGYLTAGDPNLEESLEIMDAACMAGIDILEMGVPFSDPTSDGPVIQAAAERALKAGASVSRVLEMAASLRRRRETPIVLFSYYNPLLQYGARRLHDDAVAVGVDGLLIVDLPPEEATELTCQWPDSRLPLIRLVAPTTSGQRMATIAADAGGFLYLITRTGVTGEGGLDCDSVREHAAQLRAVSSLPVCLGFGVRSAEDVASLAPMADGVVVGSALVRHIAEAADAKARITAVRECVRELCSGLAAR